MEVARVHTVYYPRMSNKRIKASQPNETSQPIEASQPNKTSRPLTQQPLVDSEDDELLSGDDEIITPSQPRSPDTENDVHAGTWVTLLPISKSAKVAKSITDELNGLVKSIETMKEECARLQQEVLKQNMRGKMQYICDSKLYQVKYAELAKMDTNALYQLQDMLSNENVIASDELLSMITFLLLLQNKVSTYVSDEEWTFTRDPDVCNRIFFTFRLLANPQERIASIPKFQGLLVDYNFI